MRQCVGEKRGRLEGMEKATGRALYAGDYRMENMLELALVRFEISHDKKVKDTATNLFYAYWGGMFQ